MNNRFALSDAELNLFKNLRDDLIELTKDGYFNLVIKSNKEFYVIEDFYIDYMFKNALNYQQLRISLQDVKEGFASEKNAKYYYFLDGIKSYTKVRNKNILLCLFNLAQISYWIENYPSSKEHEIEVLKEKIINNFIFLMLKRKEKASQKYQTPKWNTLPIDELVKKCVRHSATLDCEFKPKVAGKNFYEDYHRRFPHLEDFVLEPFDYPPFHEKIGHIVALGCNLSYIYLRFNYEVNLIQ